MNGHELWSLRQYGLSGRAVKFQNSNWWSKHNCKVKRLKQSYDLNGIFSAPPLLSNEESLFEYASASFPHLFNEFRLDLGRINKVFASQWLESDRIVMGTKCNRLMVCNLNSKLSPTCHTLPKRRKRNNRGVLVGPRGTPVDSRLTNADLVTIPSLKSSSESRWNPPDSGSNSGIHSIKINPSGTRLATGGENPSDLAIYSLPDFKPITVGEAGHSDWLFDLEWIDDQLMVSGSRDGSVAVWNFEEKPEDCVSCSHVRWVKFSPQRIYSVAEIEEDVNSSQPPTFKYPVTNPLMVQKLNKFDRVRALAFSRQNMTISAASLNSCLCILDVPTMKPKLPIKTLSNTVEMVCLCHSPDENCLALGSRSHFTFFDPRLGLRQIYDVTLPQPRTDMTQGSMYNSLAPSGVRSISWRGPVVTVGSGGGEIFFYDIRSQRFLQCNGYNCKRNMVLRTGGGWQQDDEVIEELFATTECPTAVYTHSYDSSGTRLFAAGGPIAASVQGNYASVWQ